FCGEARYKPTRERNPYHKMTPYATLRYLPLTTCLQRLYASEATAEHMIWHANHQTEERSVCHTDVEIWRNFDQTYPNFAAELVMLDWVRSWMGHTAWAIRSYVLTLARYTYTIQSSIENVHEL
ncbi:UNVERIFIED_CONTAM: hypothetical protein Slati_2404200, partial [Sesamum latifolium]